jgi:CHAT domain-containing protein
VEPLPLRAVQTALPADSTLVSYYVSGLLVHAWVVEKEAFHYVALPLRPQDLPAALCWADAIGHRAGDRGVRRISSGCAGEAARSEDLYTKLIAPLAAHIRHRKLVLVPHDVLHYLPFAALRNPATGRYLMEEYRLTYVPSASVLGFLRGEESPAAGRALVLGAPTVLDPSLKPLPAAEREAEAVARLFGARPLLAAATEGRLHGLSGKVDLVHIAVHGIYEPRDPQFSRIALAPDKDHDGNLEVHEILSDLDLSGVNLVVLSACETARGERSGGDEVTGLTRAFLHAGSPAVISTLWNIHDDASAVLMEDFYRRLLAGAPTAEALRQAQLGLLHNPRYSDPYFWAAFNLTGDPEGRWKAPPAAAQPAGDQRLGESH